MPKTSVTTRHNAEQGRIEAVTESGEVAGFSSYAVSGRTYDFFHTEVDDAYEGHGIGGQIAAGVAAFVRGEGARIAPSCPFISGWFRKHPDEQDLLADGFAL